MAYKIEDIILDPRRIFDLTKNNAKYFVKSVDWLFNEVGSHVDYYERSDINNDLGINIKIFGIDQITKENEEEAQRWVMRPSNPFSYNGIIKRRKGLFIGFKDDNGNPNKGIWLDYDSMPKFSFLKWSGLWVSRGIDDSNPFSQRHEEAYLVRKPEITNILSSNYSPD